MDRLNLFDLFAKITLDTSDYEQGVEGAKEKGNSLAGTLKSGLAAAGKAAAAGLAAASTAAVALGKASLDSYAEYEQLTGGVETLFKASSDMIMSYAENAYKTAGMSANEYMSTVTSFSASLLQSLGNDTAAAAEYADRAIIDMADNANKMGTSMEMIQNAYQGFAKQNYTMLDNLKLGYGGTKEEMERLIADAAALSDTVDVQSLSFANIVEAIHVVQTEMGITGTTAKEASSTISGSIASMKASWSNLVTGIADENANLSALMKDFVDSAGTVASNVVPRFTQALTGIGEAVTQLAPVFSKEVPLLVTKALPPMIDAGAQLFVGLTTGLVSALPDLVKAVPDVVSGFIDAISTNLPAISEAGRSLLDMLVDGIMVGMPLLANTAVSMMGSFGQYLREKLPVLIETGLEAVSTFVSSLSENISLVVDGAVALAMALAQGLADSIPVIIEKVPEIVSSIANVINDNAPKILATAANMIGTLAEGMIDAIPTLVSNIPEILKAIWDAFTAFQWLNLGKTIIQSVGNGIKSMGSFIREQAAAIGDDLIRYFKGLPAKFREIGQNLIDGLVNGLVAKFEAIKNNITGIASKITGLFTSSWEVKSPSKVFASIGGYLMDGLEVGLESGLPSLMQSVRGVSDSVKNGFDFGTGNVDFASSGLGVSSAGIINSNSSSGGYSVPSVIELRLSSNDGQTFGRWMVPFIRSEDKSNPEVVSDAL